MADNLPARRRTDKHRTAAEIQADFKAIAERRAGRVPIPYDPEVANEIIELTALGRGFVAISRMPGMPTINILYHWLEISAPFREAYQRAKLLQADSLADEIEYLADVDPRVFVDGHGVERVDPGWVTWMRNRVEAKRWIASKLKPKTYGDKLELEGNGVVGLAIQVNLNQDGGSK